MVSACAGCNQMNQFAAAVTGTGAGLTYLALSELAIFVRIDDPLDAFAVHFGGGMWGLVSACFVTDKGIIFAIIGSQGTSIAGAIAVILFCREKYLFIICFSNWDGN